MSKSPASILRSCKAVLYGAVLCSCGEPNICTTEIRYDVQPQPLYLAPGQSATADIRVSTCGGRNEIPVFDWRFTSLNTSVAVVDSISGVITGVAVGQMNIEAASRLNGFGIPVAVIVR